MFRNEASKSSLTMYNGISLFSKVVVLNDYNLRVWVLIVGWLFCSNLWAFKQQLIQKERGKKESEAENSETENINHQSEKAETHQDRKKKGYEVRKYS